MRARYANDEKMEWPLGHNGDMSRHAATYLQQNRWLDESLVRTDTQKST